MIRTITHTDLDQQLATAISGAATPPGRALVIHRVVDRLAALVAADPDATESERDSLLSLLEAADEHCWRTGASSFR